MPERNKPNINPETSEVNPISETASETDKTSSSQNDIEKPQIISTQPRDCTEESKKKIKTKFKILIAIGILFFFAIAIMIIGATAQKTLDLDTKGELKNASFYYPSDWNISVDDENTLQVVSPEKTSSALLTIMDESLLDNYPSNRPNDSFYNEFADGVDKQHGELEDFSVGECTGKRFTCSFNSNNVSLRGECAVVFDGAKPVVIMAFSSDVTYRDAMSDIIDSFYCYYHKHSLNDWVVDKEASCTEEGKKHAACTECGKIIEESIPKLNHTEGEWKITKDISISSNGTVTPGTETLYCSVCGNEMNTRAYTIEVTTSQKNALKKANQYLSYTAFSYTGLIDQLEFEGFSTEDSTFAASHCGADWDKQAEKKAKQYMNYSAFSRSGLINQLEYEGFTSEQAAHGADSVGL